MEITSLISAAVSLSAISGITLLCLSRYLTFFFFFCYTLPFLPLIASIFGADSEFWTGDSFSFAASSIQVYGLTLVWLFSSFGMLAAFLTCRSKINKRFRLAVRVGHRTHLDLSIKRRNILVKMVFSILTIAVIARFFFAAKIEVAFPGMDPLICYIFVFCWAIVIADPDKRSFIYLAAITTAYVTSQLISGDRDFFTFIFALGLLWMVRNKVKFSLLLKIGLIGLSLVIFGTIISMVRMEIEFSFDQLLVFLRFNSWNAIILPVLSMIEAEWLSGPMLYGKTYVDLLLSALPSPIYHFFNLTKPINLDNPADWYYIEGLGGLHVSGVALRNFGLVGVFMQSMLFTVGLMLTENMVLARTSGLRLFLFLVIATSIMHTIWYGLIYLVNAMTFYIATIALIYVFILLKQTSARSYKYH